MSLPIDVVFLGVKWLDSRLFFELADDNAYNNGDDEDDDNDNDIEFDVFVIVEFAILLLAMLWLLLLILVGCCASADDAMVYDADMLSLACVIIFEWFAGKLSPLVLYTTQPSINGLELLLLLFKITVFSSQYDVSESVSIFQPRKRKEKRMIFVSFCLFFPFSCSLQFHMCMFLYVSECVRCMCLYRATVEQFGRREKKT